MPFVSKIFPSPSHLSPIYDANCCTAALSAFARPTYGVSRLCKSAATCGLPWRPGYEPCARYIGRMLRRCCPNRQIRRRFNRRVDSLLPISKHAIPIKKRIPLLKRCIHVHRLICALDDRLVGGALAIGTILIKRPRCPIPANGCVGFECRLCG